LSRQHLNYYLAHMNSDLAAGLVVFLVALPLCLGIAVASGTPPFAGVISGIIGGLIVASFSGSQLSVSGPAAGLTVIVAAAVDKFGFEGLLFCVAISGLIQIVMGFLRAGIIGAYFPAAVIKGMLAAIGLILIMKQLPHAVGYDADADSDLSFLEDDSHTTLSFLFSSLNAISFGATIVSCASLVILLIWESSWIKKKSYISYIPGPLIAVIFGLLYNALTKPYYPTFAIAD